MSESTNIRNITAMTPFSYSLVQERKNVPVGSRFHLFYVTAFEHSAIELLYSSVDCFVDGERLLPGTRLENVGHYVDISSSETTDSDMPDCTMVMKIISPDGTETTERRTFNVVILDDRTPGSFWTPREVVVDVGEIVRIPAMFSPDGIWDDSLEVKPEDNTVIEAAARAGCYDILGRKPGTVLLTVSSLKYPDCRATPTVIVRESCTLDIDCKLDGLSLPTEFSMMLSSESDIRFRLIAFIEYSTYRRHYSIMANEKESEREFVSNKRCVIPNLAERMRAVMRYSGLRKVRIDYSILDYDRKHYKITVNERYTLTERRFQIGKSNTAGNDK